MPSTANTCGAIFFIIFTIVGFFGNLITTAALLRNRKLRQHTTTAFVLSLCTSDLIFSSFCMPVTAAAFLDSDLMSNDLICKMYGTAFYINFAVTTNSITGIAINRYFLIVHNHLYKVVYRKSILICQLMIIWLLPTGLMMLPLLDKYGTISPQKGLCKVMEKDGISIDDYLFAGGIVMPCIIVSVLYVCIHHKVRRQLKIVSSHISNTSLVLEKERRLTLMTLLIFISFVVCLIPPTIDHFYFGESSSDWPNVIGYTFCGIVCIINPFVYAGTNKKYRGAYSQLFTDLRLK